MEYSVLFDFSFFSLGYIDSHLFCGVVGVLTDSTLLIDASNVIKSYITSILVIVQTQAFVGPVCTKNSEELRDI
uniref:Ovule protein n=1 Tax=Strongyloides venezuelensis TaxID=75913 RepID=A0A0K0G339_STRVS